MPNRLTPIKAIRAKCLECQAGGRKAIRECAADSCPLHPYRMGIHPARAGTGRQISTVRDENGRYLKKPPSQDGTFPEETDSSCPTTPERPEGQFRPKKRQVAVSEMHPKNRRKIIRAAEAFLKEIDG